MSILMDLILNQLGESQYQSLGQQIGANPNETKSAVNEALPLLLGALTNKAGSNTGLDFLTSILDKDNDGSAIDDILGMITGNGRAVVEPKGKAALKSILGTKVEAAESHVAENSGLDLSAVGKLLPLLAPIVLAALTKAQSSQNLSGQGLKSFLENENTSITEEKPEAQSFLSSLLDKNNDGSIVDDVMKMGIGAVSNLLRK